MLLRTIATGSSGNAYALINGNEILLLDLGISAKEIKKAIDFKISDVVGCIVSHEHLDHSRSVKDFEKMGIPVYKPYESKDPMNLKGWNGTIQAFDLTDKDGRFMHTNADGSKCPCYGFLITHPDLGRMLYITDTELVKWRFKDINHILISCNYQKKYIDDENLAKRNHVFRGHMELETVKEFIKANNSNALQNVTLCHLSSENADPEECKAEVEKVAGKGINVFVARKGLEVELGERGMLN